MSAHQIAHCFFVALHLLTAYLLRTATNGERSRTMAVFQDKRQRWVQDFYDHGQRRRDYDSRAPAQLDEAATAC